VNGQEEEQHQLQHRIEMLLRQRRRIAETSWNAVASYGGSDGIYIMHDLELVTAIDAWKQRQLDEIDTQIRKLGAVDADALMAEIDRARMDYEMNERQLSKPS
jgi:hypothetical protein